MGIPIVDLFAGAGGFGVAAKTAGADVRSSVEIEPVACETLDLNSEYHGNSICCDVGDYTGDQLRDDAKLSSGDPLIVVGGAPCQPFSKAAYWTDTGEEAKYRRDKAQGIDAIRPEAKTVTKEDQRRDLVFQFWRLISESNADGFVFENVPSMLHPRNKSIAEKFITAATDNGYEVTLLKASAAEFGVAQKRERIFILGSRGERPVTPEPTHAKEIGQSQFLPDPVTAGEALKGIAVSIDNEPEIGIKGRWASHLETVPPGQNYKAHTAWAGHPNPTFVTETRFWSFLLKLHPDLPSWTIAANPGPWTGPFHWDSRRLTTDEMAALQGFPTGYQFSGSRRERVRQIGNAVPAPMAAAMLKSVMKSLAA